MNPVTIGMFFPELPGVDNWTDKLGLADLFFSTNGKPDQAS